MRLSRWTRVSMHYKGLWHNLQIRWWYVSQWVEIVSDFCTPVFFKKILSTIVGNFDSGQISCKGLKNAPSERILICCTAFLEINIAGSYPASMMFDHAGNGRRYVCSKGYMQHNNWLPWHAPIISVISYVDKQVLWSRIC